MCRVATCARNLLRIHKCQVSQMRGRCIFKNEDDDDDDAAAGYEMEG